MADLTMKFESRLILTFCCLMTDRWLLTDPPKKIIDCSICILKNCIYLNLIALIKRTLTGRTVLVLVGSLYIYKPTFTFVPKPQLLQKLNIQNILPLSTRRIDKYFFYLNYGQWQMADLTHEFRIWIDFEFWSATLDRSPQKEHWLFQILHLPELSIFYNLNIQNIICFPKSITKY